jgi:butyrate kinase
VLLTGPLTECRPLVRQLLAVLQPLGLRFKVYAGDQEMAGLRDGVLRVLKGVEQVSDYASAVRRHRELRGEG